MSVPCSLSSWLIMMLAVLAAGCAAYALSAAPRAEAAGCVPYTLTPITKPRMGLAACGRGSGHIRLVMTCAREHDGRYPYTVQGSETPQRIRGRG